MRSEETIWKEIRHRANRIGRRGYAIDRVTLGDMAAIHQLLWVLGFDDDIDEKMKALIAEAKVNFYNAISTKEQTQ